MYHEVYVLTSYMRYLIVHDHPVYAHAHKHKHKGLCMYMYVYLDARCSPYAITTCAAPCTSAMEVYYMAYGLRTCTGQKIVTIMAGRCAVVQVMSK